jgi:diacylglycerol O-acyltransferase
MAEPLSPADRSSLAAEQGRVNMTVGGVLLFEDGEGLVHDRVVERLAQRLHLIPRYRQRLAQPAPGVTNPGLGRRRPPGAGDRHPELRRARLLRPARRP